MEFFKYFINCQYYVYMGESHNGQQLSEILTNYVCIFIKSTLYLYVSLFRNSLAS